MWTVYDSLFLWPIGYETLRTQLTKELTQTKDTLQEICNFKNDGLQDGNMHEIFFLCAVKVEEDSLEKELGH